MAGTYVNRARSTRDSLIAGVLAVCGGFYMLRSLTIFPGIRASYYILPTFTSAYGIALAVFFLLRLEYNRIYFVLSFIICIAWFYIVYFMLQRQQTISVGVVPYGDVASLREIGSIDWLMLEKPGGNGEIYDALAADFRADMPDEWERFLADSALQGVTVFHVKQLRESLTGRVEIEHLSENNFGSLIPAAAYLKLKMLLDFLGALIAIVPLLPIFAAVALAVRLDSPGPIFFRQRRIGFRGEPFTVFKFRTMTHNATPEEDVRDHAITRVGDLRITRIGRFLRRARIDELPQLINILRGEMSWIGPRPEVEILSKWYETELPFYRYRHIVRPGITGWAQVNQGHVADVQEVLGKLHYDFYYIRNFSLWLDVLIAIRTTRTMLTGYGSR